MSIWLALKRHLLYPHEQGEIRPKGWKENEFNGANP